MAHKMLVPAALVLVLALAACGSPVAPKVEIAGQWAGTWSSTSGAGGSVEATFAQVDDEISGTVIIGDTPCLSTGTLSGSVSSTNVTFGAVSGADEIEFTGTVGATVIDGTYTVASGVCVGDSGSFTINRQ